MVRAVSQSMGEDDAWIKEEVAARTLSASLLDRKQEGKKKTLENLAQSLVESNV